MGAHKKEGDPRADTAYFVIFIQSIQSSLNYSFRHRKAPQNPKTQTKTKIFVYLGTRLFVGYNIAFLHIYSILESLRKPF